MERILRLKPYIYDLKIDTRVEMPEEMKQNIINSGKNQIGFIAQEMEKDFPLLVELDDESDTYTVNYVGLIPEIVKSIQELNEKLETKIAELEAENEVLRGNCCNQSNRRNNNLNTGSSVNPNEDVGASVLFQNNPNPFNAETRIKYYLAPSTSQAAMYIYDMNGKQIDRYELSNHGENELIISKGKLSAGIYFYTLIADGKEVATKTMILTD